MAIRSSFTSQYVAFHYYDDGHIEVHWDGQRVGHIDAARVTSDLGRQGTDALADHFADDLMHMLPDDAALYVSHDQLVTWLALLHREHVK